LGLGSEDDNCYFGSSSGYWTVSEKKEDTVTVGMMDSTSVVSFKYPTASKEEKWKEEGKEETKHNSGNHDDNEESENDNSEVILFNTPLQVYTNFGKGGRFLRVSSSSSRTAIKSKRNITWNEEASGKDSLWEIHRCDNDNDNDNSEEYTSNYQVSAHCAQ